MHDPHLRSEIESHLRQRHRCSVLHDSTKKVLYIVGDERVFEIPNGYVVSRGLISGTSKGAIRFYSLGETYRAKGILHFMRTQGLSAEEAAIKMEETRAARRLGSNDQDSPAPTD